MPVQLHIHAARPLEDDIASDWIVKWADEHICSIFDRSSGHSGVRSRDVAADQGAGLRLEVHIVVRRVQGLA